MTTTSSCSISGIGTGWCVLSCGSSRRARMRTTVECFVRGSTPSSVPASSEFFLYCLLQYTIYPNDAVEPTYLKLIINDVVKITKKPPKEFAQKLREFVEGEETELIVDSTLKIHKTKEPSGTVILNVQPFQLLALAARRFKKLNDKLKGETLSH